MSRSLRFAITTDADRTRALIDELQGSPMIEHAEEVADLTARMRDDSSSANLPDDDGAAIAHQVRIEYDDSCEEREIRGLVARKSNRYGLMLEFLEPM